MSHKTSQTQIYPGAGAGECVQRIKWSLRAVSSWDFNLLQGSTKAWDLFLMKPEERTGEVEMHRTRLSSKHGPELPKHAALLHTRPSPSIQSTQQSSGKDLGCICVPVQNENPGVSPWLATSAGHGSAPREELCRPSTPRRNPVQAEGGTTQNS